MLSHSNAQSMHAEYGEEVEQLVAAAREYWGDDEWAVDVKLWADGSKSAYAYRSNGINESGHIDEERLFVTDDGVRASRTVYERRVIAEKDLGPVENK